MAKRAAGKQLTQDNWDDDDDEQETRGMYKTVESSTLQNRVIKKARRTLPGTEEKASSSQSPFSMFGGFGRPSPSTPFSFIRKMNPQNAVSLNPEKQEAKQNGSKSLKMELAEKSDKLPSENLNKPRSPVKESSSPSWKKRESRDIEYYRQLKSLNECLMQWMDVHLSKNPYCDFSPVFCDYQKHLDTLDKKYPFKPSLSSNLHKPFTFKVPAAPVLKINSTAEDHSSGEPAPKIARSGTSTSNPESGDTSEMCYGAGFKSNTTNTSTFSSGIKATTTATVPSSNSGPTSSCGSAENEAPEREQTAKFTFSAAKSSEQPVICSGIPDAKPFTFAVSPLAQPKDSNSMPKNEANDDDDYVPPRNEVTVVKEDDALYSKKCKLFYKKDESYVEKGVGMLYLKPVGRSTQLLIRADTNLGNILLNIKLCSTLPMQRMGKNNVLVVCVPNPPMIPGNSESKEVAPLLIRVKTGRDADELLSMLSKYSS